MRGLVNPTSMKPRRHFDVVRAVGFCPHHALTKPFGLISCRNPSDSEERVEKFREELSSAAEKSPGMKHRAKLKSGEGPATPC